MFTTENQSHNGTDMSADQLFRSFVWVKVTTHTGKGVHARKDAEKTEQIHKQTGAERGQFRVSRHDYAKDEWKEILAVIRDAKKQLYRNSLGTSIPAVRLIPADRFQGLDATVIDANAKLNLLVEAKANDWDGVLARARSAMNGDFNRERYPIGGGEILDWFGLDIRLQPHPSSSPLQHGFAASVEATLRRRMEELTEDMKATRESMQADIAQRLAAPLTALIEKVQSAAQGNEIQRLSRSILSGFDDAIREFLPLLPDGCKEHVLLERLRPIADGLRSIPSETFKDSSSIRSQAKSIAEKAKSDVVSCLLS